MSPRAALGLPRRGWCAWSASLALWRLRPLAHAPPVGAAHRGRPAPPRRDRPQRGRPSRGLRAGGPRATARARRCSSCWRSGVVVLANALSVRHNARWDLTENRRQSLSPQSIKVLGSLAEPVEAIAFFRGDTPGQRTAEDLLKLYASYSNGKFTWRMEDPDRSPGLGPALRRRHLRHRHPRAAARRGQGRRQVREGARRRRGAPHQRPGQAHARRQARDLSPQGARRERSRQYASAPASARPRSRWRRPTTR